MKALLELRKDIVEYRTHLECAIQAHDKNPVIANIEAYDRVSAKLSALSNILTMLDSHLMSHRNSTKNTIASLQASVAEVNDLGF